jgi:hypothetical protein
VYPARPTTLMPLDITALQYLYGANTSTGNDTHRLTTNQELLETLCDAGGTAILDCSNQTLRCVLNLTLDQGERAGLGRPTGKPRLLDQVRGDAAVDDAEHPAHDLRAVGEQEAQRIRNAQHPLPHRLLGKHLVDQQRRALRHAPRAAARAEDAAFAAERHQALGVATVAAATQKTVL